MEPNQRIEQRRNLKQNYRFFIRKLTEEPSKLNNQTLITKLYYETRLENKTKLTKLTNVTFPKWKPFEIEQRTLVAKSNNET